MAPDDRGDPALCAVGHHHPGCPHQTKVRINDPLPGPIDVRDRAPDRPGDAPSSLDVEEIEMVKLTMSTSSGTPFVIACAPDANVNDVFEFIAFMAANERGFRWAFTEALKLRQTPLVDVSRGRLLPS